MDVTPLNPQGVGPTAGTTPPDPRLQPTPDYGTLGEGGDIVRGMANPAGNASGNGPGPSGRRMGPSVAVATGVLMALLVGNVGSALAAWEHITGLFGSRTKAGSTSSAKSSGRDFDREKPQTQAATLLERAVSRDDGAVDEINAKVESWRGRLKWDSQLSMLATAALNSSDLRVRSAAIEVELAAYGVTKDETSLTSLIVQANSSGHAQKIWALWTLGLLGNRGVGTEQVVEVLTEHLQNNDKRNDVDSRRWAAEGMALVGTTSSIVPLLQAMHDDPSPLVRERAACGLAQSGMLSREQRLAAVPQLLNYTEDPALDAQTHGWAFQALSDITGQRLPQDPAAWRSWYGSSNQSN